MAFSLTFSSVHEFELDGTYDAIFSLLSDVPRALSFHPNAERCVDLGAGRYRVEMKKIGTEKYHFQSYYTCDYHNDKAQGLVVWTPVKDDGAGWVDGKFLLKESGNTVHVTMGVESQVDFPLPKMLKTLVASFAHTENSKMSEKYIHNLIEACGGGRLLSAKV